VGIERRTNYVVGVSANVSDSTQRLHVSLRSRVCEVVDLHCNTIAPSIKCPDFGTMPNSEALTDYGTIPNSEAITDFGTMPNSALTDYGALSNSKALIVPYAGAVNAGHGNRDSSDSFRLFYWNQEGSTNLRTHRQSRR
jgi:hypothetical protein